MTRDEILAARTPKGGWTKATLASWGVPWPPPKGWMHDLIELDTFPVWAAVAPAPADGLTHFWYWDEGVFRHVCDNEAWPQGVALVRRADHEHSFQSCPACRDTYAADIAHGLERMRVQYAPLGELATG